MVIISVLLQPLNTFFKCTLFFPRYYEVTKTYLEIKDHRFKVLILINMNLLKNFLNIPASAYLDYLVFEILICLA